LLITEFGKAVLEFSPSLANEKWLVEAHWTPRTGSAVGPGTCEVVTGAGTISTTSGDRQIVDLAPDATLQLRCRADSSLKLFAIDNAWMLATRVTG
jgi:hypothetical protein